MQDTPCFASVCADSRSGMARGALARHLELMGAVQVTSATHLKSRRSGARRGQTQHGVVRTAADGQPFDDLTDRYARDGYVILPGALIPAEVAELRAEALRICRGEAGAVAGMEPGPPDEPDDAPDNDGGCHR